MELLVIWREEKKVTAVSPLFLLLLSYLLLAFAWVNTVTGSECGGGMVLRVDAGYLIMPEDGTRQFIGMYTSQLQEAVIDKLYPEVVNSRDIAGTTFFNEDKLRYLDLSGGAYFADQTLLLPSLFVLRLDTYDANTSLSIAANASTTDSSEEIPNGLIGLNGVSYSAVIGGRLDARANVDFMYEAIRIFNGGHNSIRRVSVTGSVFEAWKSMVTVKGGTRHEIADSTFDGVGQAGRCVWTIATSAALVHDNTIQGCTGHALDFDAYTSSSAAWNNLVQDTGPEQGQGIFVEETASGNFIFNNTLRRNFNGIAVYSLDVGPVIGNIIANNVVEDSIAHGFSSGGGNDDPSKHAEKNIFVSNTARNNAQGDFQIAHGTVVGDYWVANKAAEGDEITWAGNNPMNSNNVSVFEP